MIDIALELIRAFVIGITLTYLWQAGRIGGISQQKGWGYILAGFSLLFVGVLVDITDNFPSLNKYIVIGDTEYQAFLEKIVGYLLGYILLVVGFWKWIPTVIALRNTQCQLIEHQGELQESEKKYRRLVESLERDYIIYSHDTHGIFTYLSPSIINVLGYTQDEFTGHYTEYMTDSPTNKGVESYTDAGLRGERQLPYEAEFWHKNGSRRLLDVTEVPVFDKDGNVLGIEGIVLDITERKELEISLKEKNKKLQEALLEIKVLQGIIPICSYCHNIRDDKGVWEEIEAYIAKHSDAKFSHGVCPECYEKICAEEGL